MSRLRLVPPTFLALTLAGAAAAQGAGIPVFSIDWRSTTVSVPDSFTGTPITEGDLLAAQALVPALGPLPPPGIVESAGSLAPVGLGLGLHLPCLGHPGGTPCAVEVDALSHGLDEIVDCPTSGIAPPRFAFSVDYRALGDAAAPLPPNVFTEALCAEEFADVFLDFSPGCGPLPPQPGGNTLYIDGNGLPDCTGAFWMPGLGLSEGAFPWDNLDAFDDDLPDRWLPASTCTYFSLDSAFVDPQWSQPNSGSAAAHGFQPGDVLRSCPGCAPSVYATALQLGLDLGGAGTDDLDALALHENGLGGYQRSTTPYDWTTGATDMLFFSVRRGSLLIGTPDAIFGLPIEQGDVLFPTGPLGSPPGIWLAAEALGLSTTRSLPGVIGDDVDGLDVLHQPPAGTPFCLGDGTGAPCPCGNLGASGRGCANSVHSEGAVLWGNGFPSISFDTVRLTLSGAPNNVTTMLLQGTAQAPGLPFGDGQLCVGGGISKLQVRWTLCGNREYGYGVAGDPLISVAGGITTPQQATYQVWYRDPAAAFCPPATFNLTNGYLVQWTP